jgi:exopolysaccharide biosynthesis predicted pyruvyltransferase EpsI
VFSITRLSLKDGGAWRELDISLASGKPIYTVAMSKDDAVNTEKFLEKVPQEGNGIINRENLTPHECARIFLDADRVVTARYHGMIFTRAVGKEAVSIDKRYKSTYEVKPKDKMDAFKHIELLRTVL